MKNSNIIFFVSRLIFDAILKLVFIRLFFLGGQGFDRCNNRVLARTGTQRRLIVLVQVPLLHQLLYRLQILVLYQRFMSELCKHTVLTHPPVKYPSHMSLLFPMILTRFSALERVIRQYWNPTAHLLHRLCLCLRKNLKLMSWKHLHHLVYSW